jgi:F-type H+/Na+-transporting ATPase subunit alpha
LFSSCLFTQNQLARGARLSEILKQSQNSPLSLAEQVASIYAGNNGYFDSLEVSQVRPFLVGFRSFIASKFPNYGEILQTTNTLSSEAESLLKEALVLYLDEFVAV